MQKKTKSFFVVNILWLKILLGMQTNLPKATIQNAKTWRSLSTVGRLQESKTTGRLFGEEVRGQGYFMEDGLLHAFTPCVVSPCCY